MMDWFERLTAECRLDAPALRALEEHGFAVIEGPVPAGNLDQLAEAYDKAMKEAIEPDKRVGRTTTRVRDLPNRGVAFDGVFLHSPLLAACCQTIRRPFKLSSLLGRTLHRRGGPDDLHVDFASDEEGWPMLGFILMIDEFTLENGATRFWPGSHRHSITSTVSIPDSELVSACGPRGSVVVYNGSVCHGHGPNRTNNPRRSIQGAYIRRSAAGSGLASRMDSRARLRLSPLADYLIAV